MVRPPVQMGIVPNRSPPAQGAIRVLGDLNPHAGGETNRIFIATRFGYSRDA